MAKNSTPKIDVISQVSNDSTPMTSVRCQWLHSATGAGDLVVGDASPVIDANGPMVSYTTLQPMPKI